VLGAQLGELARRPFGNLKTGAESRLGSCGQTREVVQELRDAAIEQQWVQERNKMRKCKRQRRRMGKVARLERCVMAWWLRVNIGQSSEGKGEHTKRG